MKVTIKRIEKDLPLPKYMTNGSVGFDLCSRKDMIIEPGELKLVPLNVVIKPPEGYIFILAPRSSLFKKKGLIKPNSIGIFDHDYCGDNDEVMFQAYNITNKPAEIKRGERIGQGLLVKFDRVSEWKEKDEMGESRGGIGSTGSF